MRNSSFSITVRVPFLGLRASLRQKNLSQPLTKANQNCVLFIKPVANVYVSFFVHQRVLGSLTTAESHTPAKLPGDQKT